MNSTTQFAIFFAVVTVIAVIIPTSRAAAVLECPEHSTFNGCMTRCPVTCMNVNSPKPNCISVCTVGCECMEGFVKINKSPVSQCVKEYECPLYNSVRQQTLPYPVLRKLVASAHDHSVTTNSVANRTTISSAPSTSSSSSLSTLAALRASKQMKATNNKDTQ